MTKMHAAFMQKRTLQGEHRWKSEVKACTFPRRRLKPEQLVLGAEIAARVNYSYRRSADDRKQSIAQVLARGRE